MHNDINNLNLTYPRPVVETLAYHSLSDQSISIALLRRTQVTLPSLRIFHPQRHLQHPLSVLIYFQQLPTRSIDLQTLIQQPRRRQLSIALRPCLDKAVFCHAAVDMLVPLLMLLRRHERPRFLPPFWRIVMTSPCFRLICQC